MTNRGVREDIGYSIGEAILAASPKGWNGIDYQTRLEWIMRAATPGLRILWGRCFHITEEDLEAAVKAPYPGDDFAGGVEQAYIV